MSEPNQTQSCLHVKGQTQTHYDANNSIIIADLRIIIITYPPIKNNNEGDGI